MRPLIVHISNDYPDPLEAEKTLAIRNLVEGTPEFRHVVYSLNRVTGIGGIASIPFGQDRTAIAYGALPKGIFWEQRLEKVAEWISQDLKSKNIVPDLIEAHKLTVEGIIGQQLAAEFKCKLICDIQGSSDVKLLKYKTSLRQRYRSIAQTASLIFPYAPWAVKHFETLIGLDRSKCRTLPVLPGFDNLRAAQPVNAPRLVTILRLGDKKNKNIAGMVAAVKQLAAKYPSITLDIYGRGTAKDLFQINELIERSKMQNHIQFKGQIANASLPDVLGQYAALIMPSFAETYGLVYVEALFCGVPVLFSEGRAIDGYFNTSSIGYACNPLSIEDIAKGIDYLLTHETPLKQSIAKMQSAGEFEVIRRNSILSVYKNEIMNILPASTNTLRG